MLRTIIEGEPGIFPDPVARVMRAIGGWFGHRSPAEATAEPQPAREAERAEQRDAPAPPTRPPEDDRPGKST